MMKKATRQQTTAHQQHTIYTPSAISEAGNKCNVPSTISAVLELKEAHLPYRMCACLTIIIRLYVTTKRRERPGGSEAQNIGA